MILLRNIFPQRTPNKKKSTPWLNFHALNVLFGKSSIVTMLPDIAIMNKIGANLKFFGKWYIMKWRKAHRNCINKLLDIGDDVPGENTKPSISKRFWQYIKAKRKDSSGIPILKSDRKEITDSKQKADILK